MSLRVFVTSCIHLLAYIFYCLSLDLPLRIPFAILILSLTFLAYNFVIYFKLKRLRKENLLFYLTNAAFCILSLASISYLNQKQIILISTSGLITICYDNSIKFRERYYLKPLTITLSWTLLLIALLELDLLSSLSISIFFQILSLSILYDEKDYEQDKLYRLKTIRGELGFIETALISSLIYASSIVIFSATTRSMLIEIILFSTTIIIIRKTKSPWAFIALLDSLIFIRPMLAALI